jgi:predicted kinase
MLGRAAAYAPRAQAVLRAFVEGFSMSSKRPTLHLVCGYLGSGKTAFAKALSVDQSADYLSPLADDGKPPAPGRVTEPTWREAEASMSGGASVVMDCGFWKRADRDRARKLAAALGSNTKMYHVTCSETEMKHRVAQKNERVGSSSPNFVDAQRFEALKSSVEPYGEDEDFEVVYTGDTLAE